jgi:transketolase
MDIVAFLLFEELNTAAVGWDSSDRDVYFSSKGHDVPGLYAALHALGVVPPRTSCPPPPARRARRPSRRGRSRDRGELGLAGDGRLEGARDRVGEAAPRSRRPGRGHGRRRASSREGQNYEGLQAAAHERLSGLTVVVDRNELQSDKPTEEIASVGELEERFRAFGWHSTSL